MFHFFFFIWYLNSDNKTKVLIIFKKINKVLSKYIWVNINIKLIKLKIPTTIRNLFVEYPDFIGIKKK